MWVFNIVGKMTDENEDTENTDIKDENRMQWEEELGILLNNLAEETTLHGFKQIHKNKGMHL